MENVCDGSKKLSELTAALTSLPAGDDTPASKVPLPQKMQDT